MGAFLGFFCLLAVVASRDEESSKEKETGRVRVAGGELLREAETVERRFARSAERGSGRTKKGKNDEASKKKKKNRVRETSKKITRRRKQESKKKDKDSDSKKKVK